MIRKICTLLITFICLMYGMNMTLATDDTGSFSTIKMSEKQGSNNTTGKGGVWYKIRNTGLRFVIEYNEKEKDSVYAREELGGKDSEKYYINFVNTGSYSNQKVKVIIGDNAYGSNCSFISPRDSKYLSWERYLENDTEKNLLDVYDFATGEILSKEIDLNKIADGKSVKVDGLYKYYGQFYVNWNDPQPSNFKVSMTPDGLKLITSILAVRAAREGDTEILKELQNVREGRYAKIHIKAEILYDVEQFRASDDIFLNNVNDWMTYNQVRSWAFEKKIQDTSLRTGGYMTENYNYGGRLDFIACKLYEKDEPYVYSNKYKDINCSCSYVEEAYMEIIGKKFDNGTKRLFLNPLPNAPRLEKYLKALFTYDKTKLPTNGNSYDNTIDDYIWANRYLPNLCSMKVKFIDEKGRDLGTILTNMLEYSTVSRYAYKDRVSDHNVDRYYVKNEMLANSVIKYKDKENKAIYEAISTAIENANGPTIFEGWDYVQLEDVGEVTVNEILITGTDVIQLEEPINTMLSLNEEWTNRKQINHNSKGYQYVGVCVEVVTEQTSSIDFNDSTKYPTNKMDTIKNPNQYPVFSEKADKVTLTPEGDNTHFVVTYIYKKEYKPLGVGFEVIHWDKKNNKAIDLSSMSTIITKYNDICELVQILYAGRTDEDTIRAQYNQIASSGKSLSQKLEEVLNLIDEDLWKAKEDLAVIKSIKSNFDIAGHENIRYVAAFENSDKLSPNRVDIKPKDYNYTSTEDVLLVSKKVGVYNAISGGTQYIPKLEDIKNGISEKNVQSNDKVVLTFLYDIEMKNVTIEHRVDDETKDLLLISDNPEDFSVAYNELLPVTPEAVLDLEDYIYLGFYSVAAQDGTEFVQYGNYAPLSQITENLVITFWYKLKEEKTVTIKHCDEATGALLKEPPTEIKVIAGEELGYNPKAETFEDYKYQKYDMTKEGESTITSTDDEVYGLGPIEKNIEIIFWYKFEEEPEIEGSVTGEHELLQTPDTGENVIILDEPFTLNVEVDNYDILEEGSTIKVKFPFDVYYNNAFQKANEEIVIDTIPAGATLSEIFNDVLTFRLPSWIIEKNYDDETKLYIYDPDGTMLKEYSISIKVVGRLYDFTVTNLEKDTNWKQMLFSAIGKEYKAAQLPIGQNIPSNTRYPYGIKLGSTFLYSINTKGLKSDNIQIDTKVIYVDKDGNQKPATFYYQVAGKGEVKFSEAYTINANNFSTELNKQTRSTDEVRKEISKALALKNYGPWIQTSWPLTSEQKAYANVQNAYLNFTPTLTRTFGNFNTMKLPNTLRMPFVNYFTQERPSIYSNYNITDVKMKEDQIVNSLGHWYAEYRLPSSLYAKDSAGNRLPEDGYYIVLFNIKSLDSSGNTYLSYSLPTNNSQWMKENPVLKTNGNKVTVQLPKIVGQTTVKQFTMDLDNHDYKGFYPVVIYQAGASNDYEVGGTH